MHRASDELLAELGTQGWFLQVRHGDQVLLVHPKGQKITAWTFPDRDGALRVKATLPGNHLRTKASWPY